MCPTSTPPFPSHTPALTHTQEEDADFGPRTFGGHYTHTDTLYASANAFVGAINGTVTP